MIYHEWHFNLVKTVYEFLVIFFFEHLLPYVICIIFASSHTDTAYPLIIQYEYASVKKWTRMLLLLLLYELSVFSFENSRKYKSNGIAWTVELNGMINWIVCKHTKSNADTPKTENEWDEAIESTEKERKSTDKKYEL